jgi:hypothetical protein
MPTFQAQFLFPTFIPIFTVQSPDSSPAALNDRREKTTDHSPRHFAWLCDFAVAFLTAETQSASKVVLLPAPILTKGKNLWIEEKDS